MPGSSRPAPFASPTSKPSSRSALSRDCAACVAAEEIAEIDLLEGIEVGLELVAAIDVALAAPVLVEGLGVLEGHAGRRLGVGRALELDSAKVRDLGRVDLGGVLLAGLEVGGRRGGHDLGGRLVDLSPDRDGGAASSSRPASPQQLDQLGVFPGTLADDGRTPCALERGFLRRKPLRAPPPHGLRARGTSTHDGEGRGSAARVRRGRSRRRPGRGRRGRLRSCRWPAVVDRARCGAAPTGSPTCTR